MSKSYSNYRSVFAWSIWVILGSLISQLILVAVLSVFVVFGFDIKSMPEVIFTTFVSALSYVVMLLVIVGFPIWANRDKFKISDFKLKGLMTWTDIGLVVAGFFVYVIFSTMLLNAAIALFPAFDVNQAQNIGFNSRLSDSYQYYLVFFTLVIVAPLAEELLFRGYFFGKIRKYSSFWVSSIIVSVIFGMVHFAWNVGIDVFALSMVLCYLREITGSLWASVLLHMTKNAIAYFVLFIYPLLSITLGS